MRGGAWLAASAALAALAPAAAHAATGIDNPWPALAHDMAAPWVHLQKSDGDFRDYVLANDPFNKPRDPYGRAFMGLALLQAGLREDDQDDLKIGLRALGKAATHPVRRDRIVFENLALTTAYNLARTHLQHDTRFLAIKPSLERRLRAMPPAQFGGKRPYYNYYLVDSAGLAELLDSGLTSTVPGSALANRARTRSLILGLVNKKIPQVAARYTTGDPAGELALLSDPPWNPPAYDAFSLALMARVLHSLGPAVGPAARNVMRRAARALWTLATPDGSVSYYGRSQDQSWTLAMTAYGAEVTAALPGTSATDSARFEALADRALRRLRDEYAGGKYGFWITPAFTQAVRPAIFGLDHYADASSYSGLTLVGLNWALEQMRGGEPPAPGPLAADTSGRHRLSAGTSAIEIVRTPSLWYVVKQGPGLFANGIDYSIDVRYDSGLVGLQATPADQAPAQILPSRPHSLAPGDRAEPLLLRGRAGARFWGLRLANLPGDGVALTGGFRAGSRWLRRGVTLRYQPASCGLRMTIPTRRGDRIEQSLWFRGMPGISGGGTVFADRLQRVTIDPRPEIVARQHGFASGTEAGLVRLRLRFRGSGKPIAITFCPARGAA